MIPDSILIAALAALLLYIAHLSNNRTKKEE